MLTDALPKAPAVYVIKSPWAPPKVGITDDVSRLTPENIRGLVLLPAIGGSRIHIMVVTDNARQRGIECYLGNTLPCDPEARFSDCTPIWCELPPLAPTGLAGLLRTPNVGGLGNLAQPAPRNA